MPLSKTIIQRAAAREPEAVGALFRYGRSSRIPLLLLLAAVGASHRAWAQSVAAHEAVAQAQPHPELGTVRWGRNYDAARAKAATSARPVLILFQEIPGCATCVGYGQSVLRHPLLIEAIEGLFEPVAIFNNKDGPDKVVLDAFGEPAWNNPVVRIVDASGGELAPRVNGDYTRAGITRAMVQALSRARAPAPDWLRLLAADEAASAAGTAQSAVFAMHCFWEGEASLGALDGVLATRTGFMGTDEAVEVTFDPSVVNFEALVKQAAGMRCAGGVYCRTEAQFKTASLQVAGAAKRSDAPLRPTPSDDKHALRATVYAALGMSAIQASRVNAAIANGDDPARWLSPQQRALSAALERVPSERRPSLIGRTDLAAALEESRRATR